MQHRSVGHGRRPAPAGADQSERRDVGVSEDDPDVFEADPELVGDHLGQSRLVALAVRLLPGDHDDLPVTVDGEVRRLVPEDRRRAFLAGDLRARGSLEVRGHPDADVAPLRTKLGLASPEALPVRELSGLLDALPGRHPDEGLAGEHGQRWDIALHVVAPAHVERVDAQLTGDDVEQALPQEVPGGPGTPVGHVGGLVAEDGRVGAGDALDPGGALERAAQTVDEHRARERDRRDTRPELSLFSILSPRSTPSAVTAASMSAISSRAWPPVARCSRRSSIHFTGRRRSMEAATTAMSSRHTAFFNPNPPPTSPASTRMLFHRHADLRRHQQPQHVGGLGRGVDGQVLALGVPDGDQSPALHGHRLVAVHRSRSRRTIRSARAKAPSTSPESHLAREGDVVPDIVEQRRLGSGRERPRR